MALPNESLTRSEQYLNRTATGGGTIPEVPLTRVEQYLAKVAGEDVTVPDVPYTRIEQYLDYIAENGGGGGGSDITLTTLNVSQNGTTNAPSGTAYNKVVANVPNSYAAADEGKVVEDGTLVSQTDETISQNGTVDTTTVREVTVNVPNTYAASDEGKVVSNGALVSQTAHAEVIANGTIDTTLNNSVKVNVPASAVDSGTKSISTNGTHDVVGYASAAVSVPASAVDSGSKAISANGTHDVIGYASAVVSVPATAYPIEDKSYNYSNPAIEAFVSNVTYTNSYSSSSVDSYASRADANLGRPTGVSVTLNAGTLRQFNAGRVNEESVSAGAKTLYNFQKDYENSFAIVNSGNVFNFGNVVASGGVRVIYGSTLKNMRDIGGWTCDGGATRYGLLYRCSELTGSGGGTQMSTADKNMLQNLLGIRAELDMRDVSEDGGTASFDNVVTYLHQTIGNYADAFSSNNIGKFKIAAEFLMNNAIRGIPSVYHCVAGADRTGTITWILLGVLGVTQSDCDKEYEITNFSGPARLRSGNLANLYTYVNSLEGDNFRQKCLQALLNCGISIDLINHFRHAMIDGNPVDLEPNVIIEPITVVVDNLKASTRMSYSPAQTATSTADIVGNDNGGLALAVTTPNDWSFTDRENNTVYLMPIPEGCNKVTISTTDTSIVQYKFAALKSQSGTMTRVTNSGYVSTNVHQWATGSANFICISCIYSVDGTIKPAWSYNSSQITVTFTNF